MKINKQLENIFSLYICERDNWSCYFKNKVNHKCGGSMQACHIIPKGNTRIGNRLRYELDNVVCGCQNINWWMSAYPHNQQTVEEAVKINDPSRWSKIEKIRKSCLNTSNIRKIGWNKILIVYFTNKYKSLIRDYKIEFRLYSDFVPHIDGSGYVTYSQETGYIRNSWNVTKTKKRFKIQPVERWRYVY